VVDWIEAVLRQGQPPRWRAWSLTTLFVAMAFLVRLLLHPVYPYPFLLFIPAIFLAAFMFDRGAAFVATGESALLSVYFMEPYGRLKWPDPGQVLALLTFVLIGGTIGLLTERLRNALVDNARLRGQSELMLKQSELMLKELNHRVRNDLFRVQSFLQLEQRRDGTPSLQTAIARIAVLGQLYSHLTPKEGHVAVAMATFLEGVVNGLRDAQQGSRPIGLRLMAEPMQLPLAVATPLGLITNELVTNAFKHAFPSERPGRIDVELRRTAGVVELAVADDGVGHDPAGPATGGGLGHLLVEQLARQLGGSVATEGKGGTRVVVRIPITD
jgi:two-component sensor histidine kinase